MTKALHIGKAADGKALTLPLDWMSLSTVVYGARGSGKTTLGSVLAEEVHRAGQRFCAIDVKGDWWGLKSTADGKSAGIPVVIFGGDHADLPLEPDAGAFVAETIAELEQPTILDLENFSKGKQLKFLGAFFERLYDKNREPLLLFLDEAQRYAPQGRTIAPEASICLGAVEDLVKLGRKHGIGPMLFTQRGSGLNKEVSELCDMLVAFRTPGPLDQKRVKEWLEANATESEQREIMGQIAGLDTGTAIFRSAHPSLKFFAVGSVRQRDTFDSSATPKVGQRRKEPRLLARPDLDALKERMSETIERAKADDPKELRREIANLRKQLKERPKEQAEPVVKEVPVEVEVPVTVEVPVFPEELLERLEKALEPAGGVLVEAQELSLKARMAAERLYDEIEERQKRSAAYKPQQSEPRERRPAGVGVRTPGAAKPGARAKASPTEQGAPRGTLTPHESVRESDSSEGVTGPQQRILDALAWLATVGIAPAARVQVAGVAGYHTRTKSFLNGLGSLNSAGIIEYPMPGYVGLREEGEELASWPGSPGTTADLQAMILETVGPGKGRILQAVIDVHPDSIGREELAERLGYHPRTKAFLNGLGRLRSLGLISYPSPGFVVAEPVLFLD